MKMGWLPKVLILPDLLDRVPLIKGQKVMMDLMNNHSRRGCSHENGQTTKSDHSSGYTQKIPI